MKMAQQIYQKIGEANKKLHAGPNATISSMCLWVYVHINQQLSE